MILTPWDTREGRGGSILAQLCLGSWGRPLWPTDSQMLVTMALDTLLREQGARACPVKRGACVGGWRAPSKMATLRAGGGYGRPAGTHHGHYTTVASFSGLRCPVDRGQAAIPQGRVALPGRWVPPPGRGGVTSRGRQLVTALGFNKQDAPASTGQVWDSCGPSTEHQMRVGGGVRGVIGDTYPQAWSPRSRCWGPAPPAGSVVRWFQVSLFPFLSLLSPCLLPHKDCSPLT